MNNIFITIYIIIYILYVIVGPHFFYKLATNKNIELSNNFCDYYSRSLYLCCISIIFIVYFYLYPNIFNLSIALIFIISSIIGYIFKFKNLNDEYFMPGLFIHILLSLPLFIHLFFIKYNFKFTNSNYLTIILLILFTIIYSLNQNNIYKLQNLKREFTDLTLKCPENFSIAILIISASHNSPIKKNDDDVYEEWNNQRWDKEKQIWRNSMRHYPNCVHAYFIEADNTLAVNNFVIDGDTIRCGVVDSFIPGILMKTLIAFKALPNYSFYVRTNLSTIIQPNNLINTLKSFDLSSYICIGNMYPKRQEDNNYLSPKDQEIKQSFIKEVKYNNLNYYGSFDKDNPWFYGWAMIFSNNVIQNILNYMKVIKLEMYNCPDDVFLSIMAGPCDKDIYNLCQEHWEEKYDIHNVDLKAIFHRCKYISKEHHEEISKYILN